MGEKGTTLEFNEEQDKKVSADIITISNMTSGGSRRCMGIQLKPEEKWLGVKQIYDLFVPSPLPRGKSY